MGVYFEWDGYMQQDFDSGLLGRYREGNWRKVKENKPMHNAWYKIKVQSTLMELKHEISTLRIYKQFQ